MRDYRTPAFEIIDQEVSTCGVGSYNSYMTTFIRTENGRIIRAHVKCDYYLVQSRAYAELLTDNGSWSRLVADPAEGWHSDIRRVTDTKAEVSALLNPIIDRLLTRAVTLLALPTE